MEQHHAVGADVLVDWLDRVKRASDVASYVEQGTEAGTWLQEVRIEIAAVGLAIAELLKYPHNFGNTTPAPRSRRATWPLGTAPKLPSVLSIEHQILGDWFERLDRAYQISEATQIIAEIDEIGASVAERLQISHNFGTPRSRRITERLRGSRTDP